MAIAQKELPVLMPPPSVLHCNTRHSTTRHSYRVQQTKCRTDRFLNSFTPERTSFGIPFQAWHKRYFVLRDQTQEHCPLLEMYEKNELLTAPLGLTGPKLILDLGQCVHIGFTSDSSRFPYALVVVCQGRSPLLLAAEDELSARSWLLALGLITHKGSGSDEPRTTFLIPPASESIHVNRTSSFRETCTLHEGSKSCSLESTASSLLREEDSESGVDISFAREIFPVVVQPTETSERLCIIGEVRLVIFSHGVGLAKPSKTECFVIWPVAYIRQYQHESIPSAGRSKTTLITLEVGRRASTGEGVLKFRTQKGQEIIRELKAVVELWSKRKTVVPLPQGKVDHRTGNHRWQWNGTGRSAPCTPSLAFPHTWQKRRSSPIPNKRSNSDFKANSTEKENSELNYIVPAFNASEEYVATDSDTSTPNSTTSPFLKGHSSKSVTAAVGQDGCVRTKGARITADGYVATKEVSPVNSDDCNYVDIANQGPIQQVNVDSTKISESSSKTEKTEIKEIKEPDAYIEVLPT